MKKNSKIVRIENFGVTEEVYEHLMLLKEQSHMTLKQIITLIVNTCAKEIEFEFVEPKRIEIEKEKR